MLYYPQTLRLKCLKMRRFNQLYSFSSGTVIPAQYGGLRYLFAPAAKTNNYNRKKQQRRTACNVSSDRYHQPAEHRTLLNSTLEERNKVETLK